MGKSKKRVMHMGPHKSHGPKRYLFHTYGNKVMRLNFAQAGAFDKYNCEDSFVLACQTRGLKRGSAEDWHNRFSVFVKLKDKKEKDEWLSNCKNYIDPNKDKKKKASK